MYILFSFKEVVFGKVLNIFCGIFFSLKNGEGNIFKGDVARSTPIKVQVAWSVPIK